MLKEGTTLTVSNLQLRSEHKQLVEASASLEMSHFSTLGRTAEEKHLLESMRLVVSGTLTAYPKNNFLKQITFLLFAWTAMLTVQAFVQQYDNS